MKERSQEDIEREIKSLSPENLPWMLHPLAVMLHPIVLVQLTILDYLAQSSDLL